MKKYILILCIITQSVFAGKYFFVPADAQAPIVITAKDLATFQAAKLLALLTINYRETHRAKTTSSSLIKDETFLNAPIDTSYTQVIDGLLLEVKHDLPVAVYTRWGKWQFIENASESEAFNRKILIDVLKHVKRPKKSVLPLAGEFCLPIHGVHALPVPKLTRMIGAPNSCSEEISSQKKLEWDTLVNMGNIQLKAKL